ncbi:MAG: zinc-ribbon domain-containing protein, partial [Actinobacteria bacterium]|nr:zinc-ribbon domain-containing protein [Actinomycetota bacterium]
MAECTNCSAEVPEGVKFCPNCGAPTEAAAQAP